MPQSNSNIAVTNGLPTPTTTTYLPHEEAGSGGMIYADRVNTNPLLWNKLSFDKPAPKKGAQTAQRTMILDVPYEVVTTQGVIIKYVRVRTTVYIPQDASAATIKNSRVLASNALAHTAAVSFFDNREGFF